MTPLPELPPDPDDESRAGVARQGNVMFWLTLSCGLVILVAAVTFALVL
jgi:hypothetical protein